MVVALGAWAPTVCGQTVSTTIAPAATPAPAPPAPSPEPACPPGTPPGCNCLLQCCTPGSLQLGDTSDGPGSFCTNKPFQDDYQMRIFERVPVQINLRDYCTDEILWTSYNAPKVDRFTLVEFPCSYRAGNCDYITDPVDQEQCKAGFDVYTKELNCTGEDSFFQKFVNGRICNKANFGRFGKNGNSEYFWEDGTEGVPGNPAEVGICNCNFSAAIQRASGKVVLSKIFAKKDIQNLTVGVPDGFIKEGMSTFYVEVVVGGRSTAERGSDTECMCTGPADISAACMCELGTKKIPYVYNNSFVPTLTALVSMRKGQLFYTNTFVKFNFESTGRRGCADCAPGVLCCAVLCWLSSPGCLLGFLTACACCRGCARGGARWRARGGARWRRVVQGSHSNRCDMTCLVQAAACQARANACLYTSPPCLSFLVLVFVPLVGGVATPHA